VRVPDGVPVTPGRSVPLDVIRRAVKRAADAASLRAVARASGLSDQGLRYFVEGGTPRDSTARKLTEWYVREAAQSGELDEETAEAALSVLLAGLSEADSERTRREVVEAIRRGFQRSGGAVPGWLGGEDGPSIPGGALGSGL
jgi:hypothetical protein